MLVNLKFPKILGVEENLSGLSKSKQSHVIALSISGMGVVCLYKVSMCLLCLLGIWLPRICWLPKEEWLFKVGLRFFYQFENVLWAD